MKPINEMKLEFLSKSANEGFARIAAAAFAAQLDPTVDELTDIKTAVSEAVTNCVVHAYPNGIGKVVMTAKIYADGRFSVTIRDYGCGIENVEQALEPLFTTAPNDERSGMGFTIMENFMDKLKVRSSPGKGTRVTMEKRLTLRERCNG